MADSKLWVLHATLVTGEVIESVFSANAGEGDAGGVRLCY